jgi:hypothetical protein
MLFEIIENRDKRNGSGGNLTPGAISSVISVVTEITDTNDTDRGQAAFTRNRFRMFGRRETCYLPRTVDGERFIA